MSKVSIQGDPNGTGNFTIKAPNSNNDRQFDLPDEAGTVLTNASDIEPQVKTATNAAGSAPIYACRAWVNFNGTGTVAIRESGNVSSITDNGTGDYTVNMSTAMPDANYAAVVGGKEDESNNSVMAAMPILGRYAQTTSAFRIVTRVPSGGAFDFIAVTVSVFR